MERTFCIRIWVGVGWLAFFHGIGTYALYFRPPGLNPIEAGVWLEEESQSVSPFVD